MLGSAGTQILLAYTSSGAWRGASPRPPLGVLDFDAPAAAALNQRPFHLDLRCLARVPLSEAWFPELAAAGQGLVAIAGPALRQRIMEAATQLAGRHAGLIEIRGP